VLVHHDTIEVKFEGEDHRSKFMVSDIKWC